MTGKLNEHPLAELICEIALENLSGSLRLEQERIKTAIYFDRGNLIYATSNLRNYRLAAALRRWNVITDQQLTSFWQEGKSDADVGRALVAQGVLTQDALRELRARQVTDVLRPALLWTSGDWNFNPRVRLTEDVSVQIELPELLVEAARRFPGNLAVRRFPNTNEKITPLPEAASQPNLLPVEAFVLSRIDAPMRLHELLAISGLSEEETLHACYVLIMGGLLEREHWPRAFTAEEVAKALAAGTSATQRAEAATPAPEKKKPEEMVKPESEIDERRELDELFERVGRAQNLYQVLGISQSADQEALKRTYHRLARRFHPDRFHMDATIHSRVEDAFTKIAQAYETLKDKAARATYDLKLERERGMDSQMPSVKSEASSEQPAKTGTPSSTAQSSSFVKRGEDSFQSGLAALKMGNAALALSYFAEAARLEPKVARYRAQYGQALAINAQMRRRAETEFQEAILLEPNNVAYRIQLAKLYRDLGLPKRAQGELERALKLDPRNTEAQGLLAELQSNQGAR